MGVLALYMRGIDAMMTRDDQNSKLFFGRPVSNQEELVAAAKVALAIYPDLLAEVLKTAGVENVPYDHDTHDGVVM